MRCTSWDSAGVTIWPAAMNGIRHVSAFLVNIRPGLWVDLVMWHSSEYFELARSATGSSSHRLAPWRFVEPSAFKAVHLEVGVIVRSARLLILSSDGYSVPGQTTMVPSLETFPQGRGAHYNEPIELVDRETLKLSQEQAKNSIQQNLERRAHTHGSSEHLAGYYSHMGNPSIRSISYTSRPQGLKNHLREHTLPEAALPSHMCRTLTHSGNQQVYKSSQYHTYHERQTPHKVHHTDTNAGARFVFQSTSNTNQISYQTPQGQPS